MVTNYLCRFCMEEITIEKETKKLTCPHCSQTYTLSDDVQDHIKANLEK